MSLVVAWVERPQKIDEGQFRKQKDHLIRTVEKLLKKGKEIYN